MQAGRHRKGEDILGITPFSELPLSNNFMFGEVMRHQKVCKLFLEALLQTKIARIEYINKEQTLADEVNAHGIRMDVYLADADGTRYNIEMQKTSQKGLERRIRYYQSAIDRNFLEKGEDYENLPESYIIFVCDFDYYDLGFASYERESLIRGSDGVPFVDGSHAFILNSQYTKPNAPKEILEFLDYIRTNDDSLSSTGKLLAEAKTMVKKVRNNAEKGVQYMTWAMSMRDAKREGFEEGRTDNLKKTILAISDVFSAEEIAKRLQVSLDFVKSVLASGAAQQGN